jgi:ribosomal protein S18 acetylase RimI-like enzyme
MRVRELREADRPWASALVAEHFGSAVVVARGVLHDTRLLPGLIALLGRQPVGLLQYDIEAAQCEIVVLIACRRRHGVGRALLEAAKGPAQSRACRRLWLITTNDNQPALSFYRAVGWRQCAVHPGAVRESRRLKPEIPLTGFNDIPIEDEIEFELLIEQPRTRG